MASTIIVDQHHKQIGRIVGFANFVKAYVDDFGVPWLPIDGKSFYELSQLLAHKINRVQELERELERLKNGT